MTNYIDKGTDTDALGSYWFTVNLVNLPEGHTVSKIEVVCGDVVVFIENPVFPQAINLTVENSRKLKCGKNTAFLYGYDENGKRFLCKGKYEFMVNPEAK